jgi:hypothetical protein
MQEIYFFTTRSDRVVFRRWIAIRTLGAGAMLEGESSTVKVEGSTM